MREDRPLIVGIAGASGAGKSSLTDHLLNGLASVIDDGVRKLAEDCYYKKQVHLAFAEREQTNYDHPDAFERELLISHLNSFRQRQAFDVPVYDYAVHDRSDAIQRIEPGELLLVEGILVLHDARVRELMDIKIFVDVPLDVCLARRIKRDVAERGRDVDSILEQFERTVRKMYFQFVKPSQFFADIVVPNGGENLVAAQMIQSHLTMLLNSY